MIQRCTNPNRDDYKHYGGRGIKVCAYWLEFKNFLADMGPRPPGTSLERKNNDMGYEPGNCLWADRVTQARNSRQVVWVELDGQHKRLVEWCAELGVSINTVRDRVKYHDMGYAEALTAAPQKRGYHGRFVPREDVFTLEAQEETMRLPEVRAELAAIIDRLNVLQAEIARRPAKRRAPVTSVPATPELKQKIKAYAKAHPSKSLAEIGRVFHVNGGRVSEALSGKRK